MKKLLVYILLTIAIASMVFAAEKRDISDLKDGESTMAYSDYTTNSGSMVRIYDDGSIELLNPNFWDWLSATSSRKSGPIDCANPPNPPGYSTLLCDEQILTSATPEKCIESWITLDPVFTKADSEGICFDNHYYKIFMTSMTCGLKYNVNKDKVCSSATPTPVKVTPTPEKCMTDKSYNKAYTKGDSEGLCNGDQYYKMVVKSGVCTMEKNSKKDNLCTLSVSDLAIFNEDGSKNSLNNPQILEKGIIGLNKQLISTKVTMSSNKLVTRCTFGLTPNLVSGRIVSFDGYQIELYPSKSFPKAGPETSILKCYIEKPKKCWSIWFCPNEILRTTNVYLKIKR